MKMAKASVPGTRDHTTFTVQELLTAEAAERAENKKTVWLCVLCELRGERLLDGAGGEQPD
jgi:hypothetical protein